MRPIPPTILEPDEPAVPISEDSGWYVEAACLTADPESVFEGETAVARATCRRCPVVSKCRDYALAERLTHGVWGGLSGADRAVVAKVVAFMHGSWPAPQ